MAKNNVNKNNGMENNLSELNKDLNKMIKEVMGKKYRHPTKYGILMANIN